MICLVRAVPVDTDIFSLLWCQFGQVRADPLQMQPGDLFIQMFREYIDVVGVFFIVRIQLDLREHLVGE